METYPIVSARRRRRSQERRCQNEKYQLIKFKWASSPGLPARVWADTFFHLLRNIYPISLCDLLLMKRWFNAEQHLLPNAGQFHYTKWLFPVDFGEARNQQSSRAGWNCPALRSRYCSALNHRFMRSRLHRETWSMYFAVNERMHLLQAVPED